MEATNGQLSCIDPAPAGIARMQAFDHAALLGRHQTRGLASRNPKAMGHLDLIQSENPACRRSGSKHTHRALTVEAVRKVAAPHCHANSSSDLISGNSRCP